MLFKYINAQLNIGLFDMKTGYLLSRKLKKLLPDNFKRPVLIQRQ